MQYRTHTLSKGNNGEVRQHGQRIIELGDTWIKGEMTMHGLIVDLVVYIRAEYIGIPDIHYADRDEPITITVYNGDDPILDGEWWVEADICTHALRMVLRPAAP